MLKQISRDMFNWELHLRQKVRRAVLKKGTIVNVSSLGERSTVTVEEGDWIDWFFLINTANVSFCTEEVDEDRKV